MSSNVRLMQVSRLYSIKRYLLLQPCLIVTLVSEVKRCEEDKRLKSVWKIIGSELFSLDTRAFVPSVLPLGGKQHIGSKVNALDQQIDPKGIFGVID